MNMRPDDYWWGDVEGLVVGAYARARVVKRSGEAVVGVAGGGTYSMVAG
jgi:hypothetical protein